MIVFYQIVTKPLTAKNLPDETCPVCGQKGGVQVTLYMRYISALLPVFGLGSRTGVHCSLCSHEIKNPDAPLFTKQQYSPTIAAAIKDIKETYKRTLWQQLYPFSMCWLFLLLIIVAFIFGQGAKQRMATTRELLAHPQPGDIYKSSWSDTESSQSRSLLVKFNRVSGDTMFVVLSKASVTNSYSAKDWKTLSSDDSAFDPQEYKISYPRFLETKDFFAFDPASSSPDKITYKGAPVAKGVGGSVDFDVVERKK
jgi:hypothetical protein